MNIREFLIIVGRPAYFLLSNFFLGIIFVFYFIGYHTRTAFEKLLQTKIEIKLREPKRPQLELHLKVPQIKIPKVKIKSPRLIIIIGLTPILIWTLVLRDLPSPQELITRKQPVSTKIYDRNGILLYKIYKDENRTPVALEEIPLHVRLATLAAEDAEFYTHPGFSIRGISRAFLKNIRKGQLSGGSTITQQLVKNALLTPEKTLTRKTREVILSVRVEIAFSKDEILEMYLNEVSYGGAAYGIQEAARVYFDKDVDKLTLGEAALLAGLPKSPTKFSPFGAQPELALSRQQEVLSLMHQNGYLTSEQEKVARQEKIEFAENKTDIKAPHFVMYVRQLLAERYGESVVESGGLEVTTTLDYPLQEFTQKTLTQEVDSLTRLNVTNGAVLVTEPSSGEILAMVGSKDYFDQSIDGNVNLTLRPRQPGSSIKLINYAYALSHNYTPATILKDTPQIFKVPGQPDYIPKNYDGNFRGNLTLRDALAQSRNIPAVAVLESYGVEKMIDLGGKMGITTWTNPTNYGLSLTLGGGEVKLIDLAQAYAVVANMGQKNSNNPILKVTNYHGKILEEKTKNESQGILDSRVAYQLIDILKDNNARSPAFGTHSTLVIPGHPEVAVKTGTSNNLRDNLTVGFNQNYLVAVWVGNNDNSPMSRIASGLTGASSIWNKVMTRLLQDKESVAWQPPENLVQLPICTLTGTLTCRGCPTRQEWFLEENRPQFFCRSETIEATQKKRKEYQGVILENAATTQVVN